MDRFPSFSVYALHFFLQAILRRYFALTCLESGVSLTRRPAVPALRFRRADCVILRLNKLRDQACPAGLMRSADTTAIVAVETFVEQDIVAKMRVGCQFWMILEHWP